MCEFPNLNSSSGNGSLIDFLDDLRVSSRNFIFYVISEKANFELKISFFEGKIPQIKKLKKVPKLKPIKLKDFKSPPCSTLVPLVPEKAYIKPVVEVL